MGDVNVMCIIHCFTKCGLGGKIPGALRNVKYSKRGDVNVQVSYTALPLAA